MVWRVQCAVKGKVDKSAWERSEAADQAMRLLTLEFFNHLHGLVGNNTLYTLQNDEVYEWNRVKQFCFKKPALPLVFAGLADKNCSSPTNRATDEVLYEGGRDR